MEPVTRPAGAGEMPARVAEGARAEGLGPLVSSYELSTRSTVGWFVLGLVLAAVFLSLAVSMAGAPGPGRVFAVLAGGAGLLGLWTSVNALRTRSGNRGRRVFRFAGGMVRDDDREGALPFPWREITIRRHVQRTINRSRVTDSTTWLYVLTRPDGRTLELDQELVPDLPAWGDEMVEEVARAQLPGALADLRDGREMRFGNIRVTADTVADGKRVLTWPQVTDVYFEQGTLMIEGRRPDQRRTETLMCVQLTPNVGLLAAIAHALRRP